MGGNHYAPWSSPLHSLSHGLLRRERISTLSSSLFPLGGQVLFGLPLAADLEVHAEKNGVHDGLWNEPDDEPHDRLHPVRGDDRLIAHPIQRTLSVLVHRERYKGGPGFGHLRRHVQRNLHNSHKNQYQRTSIT
jgi:hypothetical protein